jgi:hypothetical protein
MMPDSILNPAAGILFPSIIARRMVAVDRPGIFPQQIGLHASSHFLGGGYRNREKRRPDDRKRHAKHVDGTEDGDDMII